MYRALVVCNSIYPDDPVGLRSLHGAQVDGLYLWRQLTDKSTGMFSERDVAVLLERSQREVFEAIEQFFKSAKSGDTLLLYFSGHGQPASGSLYLCLRDTVTSRIRSTGISTDEIGKIINESYAESIIILLDCCYAGGFKGKSAETLTGTGRYIISATTPVDVANDAGEPGVPSPFTETLLESLQWGAEDSDHDGLVDIDDVYRDLEARLGEEFARPERDFDGAGRVTMAKRPLLLGAVEVAGSQVIHTPLYNRTSPPVALSYLRSISLARRRHGDFSVADMRSSIMSAIVAIALIFSAVFAFRYAYVESKEYYASSEYLPERIAAAAACLLGVIHLALSIIERFHIERRLPRRLSRRRYLIQHERRGAKVLRRMQAIVAVPAIALCLGPLSTHGFVTASWVSAWTCLSLIVFMVAARLSGLGDAAFISAATLLVLGNCVPFEFDPGADRSSGFYSGLQSASGVVVFAVGVLMAGAWWWRLSRPFLVMLTALGLLSSITSAADAFGGHNPHWFLSVVSLSVSGVSVAFGAGQLLPLQATPAARAALGPNATVSS